MKTKKLKDLNNTLYDFEHRLEETKKDIKQVQYDSVNNSHHLLDVGLELEYYNSKLDLINSMIEKCKNYIFEETKNYM